MVSQVDAPVADDLVSAPTVVYGNLDILFEPFLADFSSQLYAIPRPPCDV